MLPLTSHPLLTAALDPAGPAPDARALGLGFGMRDWWVPGC